MRAYSRLMGEDEAGTARAVSERREAARPIVASHRGRIVKTTGDGPICNDSLTEGFRTEVAPPELTDRLYQTAPPKA